MTLTLADLLVDGRTELARIKSGRRRVQSDHTPRLSLDDLRALIAACAVETCRHQSDRLFRRSGAGTDALDEAEGDLIAACQGIATAVALADADWDYWGDAA